MKSKKCSYNISKPLIVENIKRFWVGSALAFIGYLAFCISPLMVGNKIEETFVDNLLNCGYLPLCALVTIIPVCAALLIYRYLQQQSSTAIVHALPLSRKQLFHSSYLSGIILCLIPIVITGIILMAISIIAGPVVTTDFDPKVGFITTNVFSIPLILKWILKYCILTAVSFTMSVFSTMLTGSSLIQLVLSAGTIFVVPGTLYIVTSVQEKMLFGYVMPSWVGEVCDYTSPVFSAYNSGLKSALVLGLISVGLYIITYCLYQKRKLEKATEALTFNFTKPIIKYFFTFLGMCVGALFVDSFNYNGGLFFFFIGAFAGALVVYIAVDMVIQKRIKIKGFIKGFGIYLIVAIAMFGLVAVDAMGYESNIPDLNELKGISLTGVTDEFYQYDESDNRYLKNPEIMKEIQSFHSDIINDRDNIFNNSFKYFFGRDNSSDCYSEEIYITYVKKDGAKVKRKYLLPSDWYKDNKHIHSVVESDEYKEAVYPILSWDYNKIGIKSVLAQVNYDAEIFGKKNYYFNEEQIPLIMEALATDIRNLKFNEMNGVGSNLKSLFTLSVNIENSEKISPELNKQYFDKYGCNYDDDEKNYSFTVNQYYVNTINLLNEWGVYQQIVVFPEDVGYAIIQKQIYNNDGDIVEEVEASEEVMITDLSDRIQITDPVIIEEIYNSACDDTFEFKYEGNCYYEVDLYPKDSVVNSEDYCCKYYDGGKIPENLVQYIN